MSDEQQGFYEFDPFRVDAGKRLLLCGGEAVPLKPKVFDTLLALLRNSGRVVDKDELMQMVWPDTAVEENNLTQNISAIRKALGERPGEHRYVVTIPGRGYRFVADVRRAAEPVDGGAAATTLTGPAMGGEVAREAVGEGAAERISSSSEKSATDAAGASTSVASRKRLLMAAAALVVLALVIGLAVALPRLRRGSRGGEAGVPDTGAGRPPGSIAVLSFKPLGAGEGDEYFGAGMADALITRLSRSRKLSVRSTGAVLRYDDPGQDALAAGRELGVDFVLDGKFQRAGDRARFTVQLVRVSDGVSLWAETFDQKFTDIFSMQDSISEQVASALTLQLSREERERMRKRYTENAEAYRAYMQGRYLLDKRTADSIRKAKDYFEEAVARDRNYALAYVGLADCYHRFAQFGISPPAEAIPRATAAAAKALELDDTLAEAHATLGIINFRYVWDMLAAEREFKRALELDPQYAPAHMWFALYLLVVDRAAEADAEMQRAIELDPFSITINNALADYYIEKREYDRAVAQYRKTLEMYPNFLSAHVGIGRAYEQKGMYDEALREYEEVRKKSEEGTMPAAAGFTYAASGRKNEARKMLNGLREETKRSPGNPYMLAVIHAGMGEKDESFKWLEKAYTERTLMPGPLRFDPRLDSLRTDPRFKKFLERLGLPG